MKKNFNSGGTEMNKLKKSAVMVMLAMSLMNSTALADSMGDKLQGQQNQLKSDKAQLQNVQSKLDSMEQNIEILDDKIGSISGNIDENKKSIANIEKSISGAEIELNNSQQEVDKADALLSERVRAMYKNSMLDYIEILLDSKSTRDLISRIELVSKIVSYDNKVIDELKANQDKVKKEKASLQKQKEKLVVLNKENGNKIGELNSTKERQKSLAVELKSQQAALGSQVNSSQAQVNATLKQIALIKKNTPKISLSRGGSPISSNSIIAYASNFLGTPYVWGGTSPIPGFDCSGFTQYVYAHFGIHLGRTTYDQIKDGAEVSRDELKPGDLVFFGSWSNPHHMGIYIGDNTYIHAPHTGDVVKVSAMTRSDYVTARRVMQ